MTDHVKLTCDSICVVNFRICTKNFTEDLSKGMPKANLSQLSVKNLIKVCNLDYDAPTKT